MADVSPTMAVLFLSAGVFVVGGTFSVGAGLILSVVVVLISLCLAELAGMFPIAGGMYSLVRRVLPGPFSWITMFNYLIQGVVIPASIALGMVAFLKDLIPGSGASGHRRGHHAAGAGHRSGVDQGRGRRLGDRGDGGRRVRRARHHHRGRAAAPAPAAGRGHLPSGGAVRR